MADLEPLIQKALAGIPGSLQENIRQHATVASFDAQTVLVREQQYIKVIPLVLEGLIKVSTRYEEKELLLYYIAPRESCVMSFSAGLENMPSRIIAETEEPTTAMLMPVSHVSKWVKEYPELNRVFFEQYNKRYSDLLDTIHHLLYNRMDARLLNYLREKIGIRQQNPLKISHRQIATELGTAREVISRVMKKLEAEGLIRQHSSSIELLQR